MKKQITNSYLKVFPTAIIISLIFILSSCSKEISFQTSPVVPAARGSVNFKTDKNKNYTIDVKLTDLAESSRLTPAKTNYTVWMITDQSETKNIGQLKSSKSGLSKKLKASLKTISAFKPVKIFITAEDEASVQYPSEQVILTTDSFNN
jgi:hypothetical protein